MPSGAPRPVLALCAVGAVCLSLAGFIGSAPAPPAQPGQLAAELDTSDSSLRGLHPTVGPSQSDTPEPSHLAQLAQTPSARPSAAASARSHRASQPKPPAVPRVVGTGGGPPPGMFEDLQYLTGSALSSRLDEYARLGVRVARFQLIWNNVQYAGPASYDWTYIDALMTGLRARGITPLPVIDTTPTWARPSTCARAEVCAPADAGQYAAFAGAAAARYAPQGVHDWEIWNEPNNPIFWQPAPNPGLYTELLRGAYAAIHRADPAATVITGGLAPAADGGGWIAPVEFLADVYANGGQGSFDAVGWHPYDYPATPASTSNNAWHQMAGTAESARGLMISHGDAGKRIWATEFGAPTCTGDPTCVSEADQALILSEGYALWSSYSWAGPLIVYSYEDRGTNEGDREDHFGLVRADGSQKPAYATFLAIATGR